MKKKVIYTLLISCLFIVNRTAWTQEIPNAGFENWEDHGAYQDPEGWDTPNEEFSFLDITVVEKEESIVHSGSASVKLETKNMEFGAFPGFLTAGEFTLDQQNQDYAIGGGIAFSDRPGALGGYLQYHPQNNDTCTIAALLTKTDEEGNKDSVGVASYVATQTIDTWTSFEAEFTYFLPIDPDTLNIIAISSSAVNPQAGTQLYIDELEMKASTGFGENELQNQISVIPHRSQHQIELSFNLKTMQDLDIRVYDLLGKQVKHKKLGRVKKGSTTFNMKKEPTQMYILKVFNRNNVMTKKVII